MNLEVGLVTDSLPISNLAFKPLICRANFAAFADARPQSTAIDRNRRATRPGSRATEVDPIDRTTRTGFLVGFPTVPIS